MDYKRIRTIFPDHLGLARGKYLPARLAENGTKHCITTFSVTYDRGLIPAEGGMLLEGLPDVDFHYDPKNVKPSWEADTGIVVGDLSYRGNLLEVAPRTVLRKAIDDWKALGYSVKVGIELEAFVLQPDGKGGWQAWDTPSAYVYGTGPAADPVGLMTDIMDAADEAGLPYESINSEFDSPQFELTLEYGDALQAVDNILLFKLLAREMAAEHGLLLTFMGKPLADRGGSGLHVNFSLVDDNGKNALHSADDEHELSKLAYECIAGLLHHHRGMSALCASTVNAYKRLQPAALAGYWANWGIDHRGTTVRVPYRAGQATRIEHRLSDGAANPYLATAAVLQAALLGRKNNLTPPPSEELDCLESQSTDVHTPNTLSEALNELEADTELTAAVGEAAVANLVAHKREEWDKFMGAITDWELNYYLPYL